MNLPATLRTLGIALSINQLINYLKYKNNLVLVQIKNGGLTKTSIGDMFVVNQKTVEEINNGVVMTESAFENHKTELENMIKRRNLNILAKSESSYESTRFKES